MPLIKLHCTTPVYAAPPPTSSSQESINTNCHRIENKLELDKELEYVTDWKLLCTYLGVSEPKIGTIEDMDMSAANKRIACLGAFVNMDITCWERVVQVLSNYPFENKRLAKQIEERHIKVK